VGWDGYKRSVASPNFSGANTLTLSEQQYFVRDTTCLSTKCQDMLEIVLGEWPPWPLCLRQWLQEKNEI